MDITITLTTEQHTALTAVLGKLLSQPEHSPEPAWVVEAPTEEELRAAVREAVLAKTKIDRAAVVAALSEFGVARASALPVDVLAQFVARLDQIGA